MEYDNITLQWSLDTYIGNNNSMHQFIISYESTPMSMTANCVEQNAQDISILTITNSEYRIERYTGIFHHIRWISLGV